MSDAPLAVSVAATDQIQVLQPGGIVLATVAQINAVPTAALAALAARVAVLEGRLTSVVLLGSIPISTVQVGSVDLAVPVSGLMRADTVIGIEVEADLPSNLDLRAWRPDRSRDGYLVVQASASLVAVALTSAVPIRVTVAR